MFTINFPGSLDSLSNPLAGNPLSSPSHADQHSNANDAIEALEAKVGANSSAVTTSHDYKLSGVTGSDKAASKTGTEILSGKTLIAPKINVGTDATGDIYYRDSGGLFQRLAIGTLNSILSVSSSSIPEWIPNPSASDASTTVKGVVEEATQAEVDAKTASGGTSARLFANPSTLRATKYNDYVIDTGSSTAYAIAPSPAISSYATGQEFTFKAVNANTSTNPTLNVNGLGVKTIVNLNGAAIGIGQITANSIVKCIYDGTNMVLQNKYSNKIAVVTTPVSIDNTEKTLITATISGGTLGINNAIRGKLFFGAFTTDNSSYTFTFKLKYGATTLITMVFTGNFNVVTPSAIIDFALYGNASTSAQKAQFGGFLFGNNSGANALSVSTGTSTEDSTVDKTFTITVQSNDVAALGTLQTGFAEKID